MKSILSINLFLIFFSLNAFCQKTYIPDDWFEQQLIDLGYDDVMDDSVLTSNIESITYLFLDTNYSLDTVGISAGLEDFTSLEYFQIYCTTAEIDTVVFGQNLNLIVFEILNFHTNVLNYINIDGCTNIEYLSINSGTTENVIIDFNNLSNLQVLEIYGNIGNDSVVLNNLTIDYVGFTAQLEYFEINNSYVNDVWGIECMENVFINNSSCGTLNFLTDSVFLESLTIKNSDLNYVNFGEISWNTQATNINIDSTSQSNLWYLNLKNLNITDPGHLDLSNSQNLSYLNLNNTNLQYLNINNTSLSCNNFLNGLDIRNNPELHCVRYNQNVLDCFEFDQHTSIGPTLIDTTIISCDIFHFRGLNYGASGTYEYNISDSLGCDTIINLDITILESSYDTIIDFGCDYYEWNGQTYTQSGIYNYFTTNLAGCDSVTTLILTISSSDSTFENITACDSWSWDGVDYTESGSYFNFYENISGCDSIHTVNLTINNSNSTYENIIACDSWSWEGVDYTESGTYFNIYENISGCDSTHTVNLTINNSSTSEQFVTVCDSYYWNGENYTESGIYIFNTTNVLGCDSIATLNLVINYSSSSSSSAISCNSYNWNGEVYFESGVYEYNTTNSFGCDSTAILNLEINNFVLAEYNIIDDFCPDESIGYISVTPTFGVEPYYYEWSNGDESSIIMNQPAGEYILTITDSIGCQLVDTITLNERTSEIETITPEICYVTVDDLTGHNKIVVSEVESEQLQGYAIFKEVLTGVYQLITTLDANNSEYVDQTSNPLVNSNRYKIELIDDCQNSFLTSDYHQTVHLSMNLGLGGSVNLYWSQYEGFDVSSYMVFRGSNINDMNFIGFVSGNTTSYSDLTPPVGTSIYQVRVVAPICNPISSNPNANFALIADTLKSNIVEHDYVEENDDLGVNIIVNNPSCETCNDGSLIAQPINGLPPYSTYWSNGIIGNFNFGVGPGTYTAYVSDANGVVVSENVTLTPISNEIFGCTDQSATNYNSDATQDDGSCEYTVVGNPCDITPSGLFVDNIIHERVAFNWSAPSSAPSYYMIRYRPVGTSSWTVMSAGSQNDIPFTGTTRTRYFMEPGTTYQWNIRARVVDENGATVCQSPWSASHQYTTLPACANLTDLSVNSEANLVYFNAIKPSGEWGIWQAKGKIREIGSNNYRYLATTVDNYTNQIKYNFTPSTDYEWHTKAWCTGNVDEEGNPDPQYHSGWGEFSAFTTQDPCDKLPVNLSTQGIAQSISNILTMSWDTPISGQPHHYFLELNNETSGQTWQWNNIPGSSNIKSKYNLTEGVYSWRIRGACGENGTSWATPFTGYEYYTLGGNRLANDTQSNSQLTNISVYPNPSRGEFSISFDLESRQDVYLSITNYLGEVIFTEELKDEEVQYNKTIDLGNKANGIYMLNITTNNQNINQKLVIH